MNEFSKENTPQIEGIVEETLPSLNFKVRLKDGREILAYLGGKLKLHRIKVLAGDKVIVKLSEDERRGRIIKRL